MRCSFEPATRERHLVLCDPAALPSPACLDAAPGLTLHTSSAAAAISRLAEEGRALVVQVPEGDCHATFHVLVDEEPAQPLRDRASGREGVRGAVLHLPSGTLTAGGVELLERGSDAQAHVRAAVPPGVYQLDAVHLAARQQESLPAPARWPARVARVLARLAPAALGAGLVAAALSATVAAARGSWTDGATAAAIVLAVVGALLAFTSLFGAVARLYPGRPPSPEVIAALERENPHIVVVLRAIREAPPRFPPARLRIGV